MKFNFYLIIFLAFSLLSCEPEEEEPEPVVPEITAVSPAKAKIGDTISISGSNLTELEELFFVHEDRDYNSSLTKRISAQFISWDDEEIRVTVPALYHQDILIRVGGDMELDFELTGLIPIDNYYFDHISQVQVFDDQNALISNGESIFRSTDGFYSWEPVMNFPENNIDSFFFLDEETGWISSDGRIFYTENGGQDFTLKYEYQQEYGPRPWVREMQFVSDNFGLLSFSEPEIFMAKGEEFADVYELYPQLHDLPFGEVELYGFSAVNEELFFLSPDGSPHLIKVEGQEVSYTEFETFPNAPWFFEDTGYVQANSDIYKSTDLGDSWTKIKTFEGHYPEIHFLDKDLGFAFVNYSPNEIYQTTNGGERWEKILSFPEYQSAHTRDFDQNSGLIATRDGKMLKWRRE